MPTKKTYEYKIMRIEGTPQEQTAKLNEFGADGWLIVAASNYYVYFMKTP